MKADKIVSAREITRQSKINYMTGTQQLQDQNTCKYRQLAYHKSQIEDNLYIKVI